MSAGPAGWLCVVAYRMVMDPATGTLAEEVWHERDAANSDQADRIAAEFRAKGFKTRVIGV